MDLPSSYSGGSFGVGIDHFDPVAARVGVVGRYEALRGFFKRVSASCWTGAVNGIYEANEWFEWIFKGFVDDLCHFLEVMV